MGWLIRPDLVLLTLPCLAAVLIGQRACDSWRSRAGALLAALAIPAAYQLFRMGYFASIVPNTALAKEAGATNWSRGWEYFTRFVGPYWLWVPALLLVLGAYVPHIQGWSRQESRRTALVACALSVGAVLNALYIVRVGGD